MFGVVSSTRPEESPRSRSTGTCHPPATPASTVHPVYVAPGDANVAFTVAVESVTHAVPFQYKYDPDGPRRIDKRTAHCHVVRRRPTHGDRSRW